MSRRGKDAGHRRESFPRVSGDEPGVSLINWAGALFSPRERG